MRVFVVVDEDGDALGAFEDWTDACAFVMEHTRTHRVSEDDYHIDSVVLQRASVATERESE